MKETLDTKLSALNDSINSQKNELSTATAGFEEKLAALEKDTLWKIKDFEDLLEKRISEFKVNTLLEALDKKFTKMITETGDKSLSRLHSTYNTLDEKIKHISDQNNFRNTDIKATLERHAAEIEKCALKTSHKDLEININKLKQQVEGELDAIQGHVRESKDKCAQLIKKMANFQSMPANQSAQGPGSPYFQSFKSPLKIEE